MCGKPNLFCGCLFEDDEFEAETCKNNGLELFGRIFNHSIGYWQLCVEVNARADGHFFSE